MSMTLREGVVQAIVGDVAVVKKRNGQREIVAVQRLRVQGEKSQITEFVEAMVESNRTRSISDGNGGE